MSGSLGMAPGDIRSVGSLTRAISALLDLSPGRYPVIRTRQSGGFGDGQALNDSGKGKLIFFCGAEDEIVLIGGGWLGVCQMITREREASFFVV